MCFIFRKQIINIMTLRVFGKVVHNSECKYIRKILHSIPVLPLHVPQVMFALVNHLELLIEMASTSHRVAYRAMILDVQKRYLSASHRFSFTQAEHYHSILEGDTDCTSSRCESLNANSTKQSIRGLNHLSLWPKASKI